MCSVDFQALPGSSDPECPGVPAETSCASGWRPPVVLAAASAVGIRAHRRVRHRGRSAPGVESPAFPRKRLALVAGARLAVLAGASAVGIRSHRLVRHRGSYGCPPRGLGGGFCGGNPRPQHRPPPRYLRVLCPGRRVARVPAETSCASRRRPFGGLGGGFCGGNPRPQTGSPPRYLRALGVDCPAFPRRRLALGARRRWRPPRPLGGNLGHIATGHPRASVVWPETGQGIRAWK